MKTITIRKMVDALRYGKNVRQTTGRFIRYGARKPLSAEPIVIGSACAVGKIALSLGIEPESFASDVLGADVSAHIIGYNDQSHMTFSEIADLVEKNYINKLDKPIQVIEKTYACPIIEMDRS